MRTHITKIELADALDAFWNAAIGHCHRNQSTSLAMDTVGAIAEGFSAIAYQLRAASEEAPAPTVSPSDPLAVLPPLPEDWFLLKAEHSHTRIVYRGDRHEPLPHGDGAWFVELQHLDGGRATSERGKSLFEAATAAVRSVQLREKEA